jgi:hypothetical protein
VLDIDKGNILNFIASLALASSHCNKLANMLQCGFIILPTKLRKLRDSIASKVGELVVVVGVWLLVDTSSAFRFYVEEHSQDSSQLVG